MRIKLLLLALITALMPALAQSNVAQLQGTVVNSSTGAPVNGAQVSVFGTDDKAATNFNGEFVINAPAGTQKVVVSADGYELLVREVMVAGRKIDLSTLRLIPNDLSSEYMIDAEDLVFDEAVLDDEEGSQNIAALTGANDNLYYNTASYNFGPMYWKYRGLQNEYQEVYINGINMNDRIRGRFNFSTLLGMTSRAFRNKSMAIGTDAASYGFGDLGGATNYNTVTDTYATGFNGSVAYTNSNYMLRGMVTYASGLNKKGWAYTVSAIGRWANEGVIEGTFYNSGGLFLSLEKQFNPTNSLTLTAFGGPTQRATASATYQEVYDLVGSNLYNPNWGWQDGKKRSSRIVNSFDPTVMLTWLHKGQKTTANTSAAIRWINYSQSALQYFNANDPNPTYYRYLPSYFTSDESMQELYTQMWESRNPQFTQINWENLYRVNYLNNYANADKPEADRTGASYILEDRHSNQFNAMFNSYINHRFNNNFALQGGVSFNYTKATYYKTVRDLLGGEFWVDVDPFSDRDIQIAPDNLQNDLDNPNRRVYKGDRFGYDYDINFVNAEAWLQNTFTSNHWDVNYAFRVAYTQYFRDGKMRNGRAPENSLGHSATQRFDTGSLKIGATYKLDGRNFFMGHAEYASRAPLADQVFIAPRVKNSTIENPGTERDLSFDLSYGWNYRRFRGSLGVYYIDMTNVTERTGFYDDNYSTYAIYALQGVRKVNKGVELGMAYKITPSITATFAGTFARFNYKNNPRGTRSFENGLYADTTQTVYLRNYYMGSTPQTVANLGIDYAAPKNWFFNLNGTWQGDAYVNLSPRYHEALPNLWTQFGDSPEQLEAKIKELAGQDKLKDAFSLNLSIGKMLYVNRKVTMNFNVNINNILNNRDIVTYAYQQGRLDEKTYNRNAYPNKLSYAQGTRVFVNVGIRF